MTRCMKLIQKIWNGMQRIHGSKFIYHVHKGVVNVINATTVQNDVIVRRFTNTMNMVMYSQYGEVIMQLMMDNMIMMYEYAIKEDHNKFAKEVNKLIYHG